MHKRPSREFPSVQNVVQTDRRHVASHHCSRGDKRNEVTVVSAAYTVVEPDAVMVVQLDTIVAHGAVADPRGPPDAACGAVLDVHSITRLAVEARQSCNHCVFFGEIPIMSRGVDMSRQNAWVHGAGLDKGRNGKKINVSKS